MSAEQFLYLTTIGRTSGLPRTIEIWFVEHDAKLYIVSEMRHESGWVKNLMRNPNVAYRVGTRTGPQDTRPAVARIVHDAHVLAAVTGRMDRKYGWSDGLVVEIAPE